LSKLPVISGGDCVKALQKAGFEVVRERGSHIILRRNEPEPARTVPVPNHRELKQGTLRGIIRLAGLTPEEFIELL
jgi:predicted RNA binding protein YcfA (HicA-like mRNA interferase family)